MGNKLRLDESKNQYQLLVDDKMVSFEVYVENGKIWEFVHTRTLPGYGHKGYATELVHLALDDMRAHDRQVLPYCPFVRDYIAAHPAYIDLVPANARSDFGLDS